MLIFHASPTKMYIPQPHGKFNMAGANQPIDIDDREIRDGLKALQDKLGNLTPFYQDIGEALLNSTRRRFETQTAPDGSPWAPLSPGYEKRKKKNKDKILTLEGLLRGLLNYDASADALLVGTPLGYGSTHQFGRGNIPARPFLGLSTDDTEMILDALADWLLPE
jgi:phage virion morphogenesis protein